MAKTSPKSLCDRLGIEYPIIQAGMIWVSGAKLAAAAANAGILGVIGAGSMKPDVLRSQLQKVKDLTNKPVAVNVPQLYRLAEEQIETALGMGIKIFITSAGSPKKFTKFLQDKNCFVMHATSSPELALKCQAAGVDAVIAEGFEAGGHNGRDEITTMCLIPQVVDCVDIPVVAAGGIGDARGMAAAFALGADAVQIGTRFACTQESSAHPNFKNAIMAAESGSTHLTLKQVVPVRLLKNKFFTEIQALENQGATAEELTAHLGKGRAKAGMHDGDLDNGELEIGQISALLKDEPTVAEVVATLVREYEAVRARLPSSLA